MSIVSLVDNKVVAEKRKKTGHPKPDGVPTNIVNQLMMFVPTEVVTLWIAYLGLITIKARKGQPLCTANFSGQWTVFYVFCGSAAALALGLAYRKFADSKVDFSWPLFEMLAATVGFAAWAFALPKTPLADFCGYKENVGTFVVLVATVGLTTVGYIMGKAQRFEKV